MAIRQVIVNADDFGYSFSVNKGIIEGHKQGIITSTSVMIDAIAADEAVGLLEYPNLAVGLHFVPSSDNDVEEELDRQIERFISVTGNRPTHIDIHKPSEDDINLKETVGRYAKDKNIPYRYSGEAHFIDSFFGPLSNGEISVDLLKNAFNRTSEGLNEIMTHVGYSDDYLNTHSSYNTLREEELKAVCSQEIKDFIELQRIELTNWSKIKAQ